MREAELFEWEQGLIEELSPRHAEFTPYPTYFEWLVQEMRLLRWAHGDVFDPAAPHRTIVEIGCGFGFQSVLLSRYAEVVRGFDIPVVYENYVQGAPSFELARQLTSSLGVEGVHFDGAWPNDLPLADASVDLVFSSSTLEHIPDLAATHRELARVVRPGGWAVHVVPSQAALTHAFIEANSRVLLGEVAKSYVRRLVRRTKRSQELSISANGSVVPPAHTEYVANFVDQLSIYTIQHYVYSAIDAGFRVDRIGVPTRETTRTLVLRRR